MANLSSLVFPPHVFCDSLVIPVGIGKLIRYKNPDIFYRKFYSFAADLNMKWLGGLNGDNGWIGILYVDSNYGGALIVNSHVTPTWLPFMGKSNNKYNIEFRFTEY